MEIEEKDEVNQCPRCDRFFMFSKLPHSSDIIFLTDEQAKAIPSDKICDDLTCDLCLDALEYD